MGPPSEPILRADLDPWTGFYHEILLTNFLYIVDSFIICNSTKLFEWFSRQTFRRKATILTIIGLLVVLFSYFLFVSFGMRGLSTAAHETAIGIGTFFSYPGHFIMIRHIAYSCSVALFFKYLFMLYPELKQWFEPM